MLNQEDCEKLDKLFRLIKSSPEYDQVTVSYNKDLGWHVDVWPDMATSLPGDNDYWHKDRVGNVINLTLAALVQKKLGG